MPCDPLRCHPCFGWKAPHCGTIQKIITVVRTAVKINVVLPESEATALSYCFLHARTYYFFSLFERTSCSPEYGSQFYILWIFCHMISIQTLKKLRCISTAWKVFDDPSYERSVPSASKQHWSTVSCRPGVSNLYVMLGSSVVADYSLLCSDRLCCLLRVKAIDIRTKISRLTEARDPKRGTTRDRLNPAGF